MSTTIMPNFVGTGAVVWKCTKKEQTENTQFSLSIRNTNIFKNSQKDKDLRFTFYNCNRLVNFVITLLLLIVTCEPIVGLRNRGYATRFQAPAGKQGFRTDAMTSRNSIGIRFLRNMPR
jgi:hypothetical protein